MMFASVDATINGACLGGRIAACRLAGTGIKDPSRIPVQLIGCQKLLCSETIPYSQAGLDQSIQVCFITQLPNHISN
ncbi:MAG: hypothetical protein PHQ34_00420 [Methanothrix sp.]|nr:hypothetical protein [Methanothrix sp.]